MTTLTVRAEIGGDGKLRLEVPCQLPPGPVEVVLVVQPAVPPPDIRRDLRPHPARTGIFKDRRVEDIDIDRALGEMNAAWKSRLDDLS